jgi:MFS family permease
VRGALSWPFLRLYLLTLCYYSANAILNVILPLRGESLGATNATIGIIMGAYLMTTMLFRPWAGQIIHKHGPMKVLRTILAVNGLALILYAFTGLGGYLAARMLQGVCTAFFSMSLQLGIIDALPDKDRSQGISMYSLCSYLPGILGPLAAVGIWHTGEMSYFTFVMIFIAVVTGVVGYGAKMDSLEAAPASGDAERGAPILRSFGLYVANPHLFRCSLLMLVASVVFGATATFIPLYAEQIENGSAAVYLMIQAGIVVAARFILRKRIPSDGKWHSPYMMGIMSMLAAAALCVSYSSAGGAAFFYAGAVLMGIAQALLYPTLTTYLTFVSPKASRNMFIGLFIAMADLGVSLGGILMGPIADLSSYSAMYLICAALGGLMILFAYERRGSPVGTRR